MGGRPPKPTPLKIVGGNAGHRPLNKQEPDPMRLIDLTPPAWLPDGAAAVYTELAPLYQRAGLLTEVDRELFAKYAYASWQYREAAAGVSRQPILTSEDSGNDFINPLASYQSMMFKQALAMERELGGTPAARTRIAVQPQGDMFGSDPFGSFVRAAPTTA